MRPLVALQHGLRAVFAVVFLVVLVTGLLLVAMLGYLANEVTVFLLHLPGPVLVSTLVLLGSFVLGRLVTRPPTLGHAILHELAAIRLGQSLRRR